MPLYIIISCELLGDISVKFSLALFSKWLWFLCLVTFNELIQKWRKESASVMVDSNRKVWKHIDTTLTIYTVTPRDFDLSLCRMPGIENISTVIELDRKI